MAENQIPVDVNPAPPPPALFRWTVLLVICSAMFCNYYIFDSISPLADVLKAQLGFTDSNLGWLVAIYHLPNIVFVLIGGLIIDRIGTRKATVLFASACMVGAAITASSGTLEIMALGRLVYGLGSESLMVAVITTIAKWFRGKELGFAFGIGNTIARLGSFTALNSPTWASPAYANWQWPLLIAACFGVFCLAGTVAYGFLEGRAAKRYDLRRSETDKFVFRDLFRFSRSYWFIVAVCITFYSAILPFQTFAIKFFIEAHGATRQFGGFLSSMIVLLAMVCTPLCGLLADRIGKRSLLVMLGSGLLIPVYLLLAYAQISLFIPMALMGTAFALVPAILWPSVSYTVEQSRTGTAFGMMMMVQNIGISSMNMLIGWANDFAKAGPENPGGYAVGMWIFTGLALLGFFFAYMLRRTETGPHAQGLETITIGSEKAGTEAQK